MSRFEICVSDQRLVAVVPSALIRGSCIFHGPTNRVDIIGVICSSYALQKRSVSLREDGQHLKRTHWMSYHPCPEAHQSLQPSRDPCRPKSSDAVGIKRLGDAQWQSRPLLGVVPSGRAGASGTGGPDNPRCEAQRGQGLGRATEFQSDHRPSRGKPCRRSVSKDPTARIQGWAKSGERCSPHPIKRVHGRGLY